MNRIIALDSRRALAWTAAAALFLLSGCAIKLVDYADEQVQPYVRSLPKRPDRPLARTLTWKYYYTEGKGGLTYFVADGNLIRDKSDADKVQVYAAQPVTSGITANTMSNVYAQRALEATKRGDHQGAQVYHGLSAASLQTQLATQRSQAGAAALSGAIMAGAAGLADIGVIRLSQSLAFYVKDDRAPLVGDSAPEGTVLELFFQRRFRKDTKPPIQEWETVATLKDAEGKIWRSVASFNTYHFMGVGSGPVAVPDQYRQRPYVLLRDSSVLPADQESYAAEEVEIAKIKKRSTFVELGVTSARAIEDIYDQIEFARRRR
jgi:hypothetical protein